MSDGNGASVSSDHLNEVWSWLHDEQRCVTVRSISLHMGLSRRSACALLEQIPSCEWSRKNKTSKYEMTRSVIVKGDSRVCVRLEKEILHPASPNENPEKGTAYALSLLPPSDNTDNKPLTIQNIHEQDMSDIRSAMLSESDAFDPDLRCASIRSNPRFVVDGNVSRVDLKSSRERRIAAFGPKRIPKSNAAPPIVPPKQTKKHVTTAASFFANNETVKKSPNKETVKKSSNKKTEKENTEKETTTNSASSDEMETDETLEEEEVKQPPKKSKRTKRKNPSLKSSKPSSPPKKPGNADDFIGDEDEDEDDVKIDIERKKRLALEERIKIRNQSKRTPQVDKITRSNLNDATIQSKPKKTVTPNAMRCDSGSEEEDTGQVKIMGGMDDFVNSKNDPQETNEGNPRRKKRFVEKTTVDEKGYLHTETTVEWEDVSLEELEKEARLVTDKKKPNKTAQMTNKASSGAGKKAPAKLRQAGLSAFFKKK